MNILLVRILFRLTYPGFQTYHVMTYSIYV